MQIAKISDVHWTGFPSADQSQDADSGSFFDDHLQFPLGPFDTDQGPFDTDQITASPSSPLHCPSDVHFNCSCNPFELLPVDANHGVLEALPSSNPLQHAPDSNIAERIRDTDTTATMDPDTVEKVKSESEQVEDKSEQVEDKPESEQVKDKSESEQFKDKSQSEQFKDKSQSVQVEDKSESAQVEGKSDLVRTDEAVVAGPTLQATLQELPQPNNETAEHLRKEQGQTEAPAAKDDEKNESAPSPHTHNEPMTDAQIITQNESLPTTTADAAPIADLTQLPIDPQIGGDGTLGGVALHSQHLPTTGPFNLGTNTSLIAQTQSFHGFNTQLTMDMNFGLLPGVDLLSNPHTAFEGTAVDFMDSYEPPVQPPAPATGFAKLEFLDGHFYMTTYAVELGRDMRAFRVAQTNTAHKQIFEENMAKSRKKRSPSVPGTPARQMKIDAGASVARSFVSEQGGIVGEDDGHISLNKKRRKKGQKSRSTGTSSSQSHLSRKNSTTHLENQYAFANQNQHFATVDPNMTAPLDPMVHMPDPAYTPLIPIHPPITEEEPHPTGKGISRKHVRIAYNFEKGYFEMDVYGRNGAFHDGNHCGKGDSVALHDGSQIQIGGVLMKFVLPTVPMSDEEVDEDLGSVSGRMSFCFEDTRGASIVADDDESVVEDFHSEEADPYAYYDEYNWDVDIDDEEEDDDDEVDYESPQTTRQKVKAKAKAQKYSGKPSGVVKPEKSGTKLKIKFSSKQKARAEAEAKEREKERERERARDARREERRAQKAKKEAKKAKREAREAKEAAKAAKAKLAKETAAKQAEKRPTKDPTKQPSKQPSHQPASTEAEAENSPGAVNATGVELAEPSKELSKTPVGEENKPAKEPPAVRINRDAPLQNGEEVTVPGLPAGLIIPARKKGPGRPPKDGVMSKRERALLIKQNKEREKAIKLGLDPSQIPPPEMKPPKPRPRKNSQGEDIEGDDGDDDKKSTRMPRAPRSPSPEMKIEDYTEEQLQRPQPNYVYLIYEAINACPNGVMNLQQIYSAIERKYPYFKFRTTSNGWQSSVRHNLGQHEAFRKVEKEGKGWLWGIKDGVPIERERKKKTPPPQAPPNGYNQAYPPSYPQYQYPQHATPHGAPPSGAPPNFPQGPPPQGYANQRPPNAAKPPPSLIQANNAPRAPQPQSYSSPYAKDNNTPGGPSHGPMQPPRPGPYQAHPPQGHPSQGHPQGHPPQGPYSAPPHYQSGYRPNQPNTHGVPPTPVPSGQANNQMQPHHPGYPHHTGQPQHVSSPAPRPARMPSQDVIDTFRKVFIATIATKEGMGSEKATVVVNNAIKRVLEPEAMKSTPAFPEEDMVTTHFSDIVRQTQGPPRQATPSQNAPMHQAPPHTTSLVANAAATAAMAAKALPTAGPTGNPSPAGVAMGPKSYTPPTGSTTAYRPPQPHPTNTIQPQNRSLTPAGPPIAQSGPPSHGQEQRPRPAEASLMGMLVGKPATGNPSVTGAQTPATAPTNGPTSSPVAGPQSGAAPGLAPRPNAPMTAPKVSPPAIAAIGAATRPSPPMTAPSMVSASTSKSPLPFSSQAPMANMGQLSQLSERLNDIVARANGTVTPTRPAVEPLTPPPGTAPALNAPPAPQTGKKRGPSPQAEAPETKKTKVDASS
ncbi:forkhead domain-containing protein [Venturia nashicola]|uniref:Forkhead domain-containing protein n=1 Tax=Venturia nashicola TaxID=86259 RepID=A0A4Z1P2Q4_9PEZI|nr:forkhead domain-containing protein [Venturia nashicola]TLD32248.1 forkhead domain-containing protein [Venturia nashicola]